MQFRQQSDMSLKPWWFLSIFSMLLLQGGSAAHSDAASARVVTISPAALQGWQERRFHGETAYRVEEGGRGPALHAIAQGSASGRCLQVGIDLRSLPVLRWSWRLDQAPPRRDERNPEGDDQGLRLSFLYQAGVMEEDILAVQYVWSQSEKAGAMWPNPFVANAHQLAARSGPAQPGRWQTERRDLRADFRAAFGQTVDRVDAVCLMTDGDQTGALVEGWYGDMTFQAR
jgi:hypothetical protein